MSVIDNIKNDIKKSGQNKGKILYVREGVKTRIRFLQEMDTGMEVKFHDHFEKGINVPCQEQFGRPCSYCEREELRTRVQYIWSVWDYEAKEVKLLMYPVNNCSPIPHLLNAYENYGTIMDRDYVLTVQGKQQNKTFSVLPMDKVKFRNEKAKPYSETAILKILDKAFPSDDSEDEDEDVDYSNKKVSASTSKSSSKVSADDNDWDDEVEDEAQLDYESMSAKELYKLCKERDIEAEIKKPVKYYVTLLKEYDEAHNDWGDEETEDSDEDVWEDE